MKSFALLTAFAALSAPLSAAIIIAGDVGTPGAPCTLTITTDIVSEITADPINGITCLVFDNWVTADAAQDFASLAPELAFTVNDGPTVSLESMLADNWVDGPLPDMEAGDGYLYVWFGDTPLQTGDIFTIKAGTYTFNSVAGMNPQIAQTFEGNFFIADETGTRIANIVDLSVPEPSAALLGAVGSLALLRRRR